MANFRVGKPVRLKIPCAGLEAGDKVRVLVHEPHALGGDPVETIEATVDDGGFQATAEWTYDHAKNKDKVAAALFVLLIEGAGRTSASPPIQFVDRFQATVKDPSGHPASYWAVVLHADRGENVPAETDAAGKVNVLVPPGNYHVELKAPLPPDRVAALRKQAGEDDEDEGEDQQDQDGDAAGAAEADAGDESDDGDEAGHYLSARFLDRTAQAPAKGLALEVEGVSATTDDSGKVLVPDMPWQPLTVKFEGGTVLVPAVHDAALVLRVALPFLDPPDDAGDAASDADRPDASTVARPEHLFPAGETGDVPDGASGDEDEATLDDVTDWHYHGDPGEDEDAHFLSARFFDRSALVPAKNLTFEVEGVSATTDDRGKVLVPNMPWQLLEAQFDGGTVRVPAVHDPALVLRVALPFLEPASDAGGAGSGDADRPDASSVARPENLFPAGEPGDVPGDAPDDASDDASDGAEGPPLADLEDWHFHSHDSSTA